MCYLVEHPIIFCMCFYILPKLFFNFILFILLSYPKRDGLSTVPAKIILSKQILNLHVKGHLSFARPSPCLPETEKSQFLSLLL